MNYQIIGSTAKLFEPHPEICGWSFWPWKKAPTRYPGLVTIKLPADWRQLMSWINHPLLNHKPTEAEARRALGAFLGAIKLAHGQWDQRMLRELLGQG